MGTTIAGVCLLNKPYYTDAVYDYRVPEELVEEIRPGLFVTVPFGNANAQSLALVWELKEESVYKSLKEITSVCPDSISLDGEMLGLCAFMKERTLCTTGDAVRAMVPASAISRLCEIFSVHPDFEQTDSETLQATDSVVFDYMRTRGEVNLSQLRRRFGFEVEMVCGENLLAMTSLADTDEALQAFAAALLQTGAIQAREIRVSRLDIPERTQYNKGIANQYSE